MGFEGNLNADDKYHGYGIKKYKNGEIYEGFKFINLQIYAF